MRIFNGGLWPCGGENAEDLCVQRLELDSLFVKRDINGVNLEGFSASFPKNVFTNVRTRCKMGDNVEQTVSRRLKCWSLTPRFSNVVSCGRGVGKVVTLEMS